MSAIAACLAKSGPSAVHQVATFNLELAESAGGVSLGWTKRSPMLAKPSASALPAPLGDDDD
jgi:hypothetical protein